MRSEVYEIRTPENVLFRFERAGLASRALAWAVDVVVMAFAIQLAAVAMSIAGLVFGRLANALLMIAVFLVQWWYGALAEWRFSGLTLGKWVLGLRTIDRGGLKLTLYQAIVRNLLRVVDLLPGLYLVGGLSALIDPHGRRLGDIAAATLVIREQRAKLAPRRSQAALTESALSAELRESARRATPAERDAALAMSQFRDDLPLHVRAELFEELARRLCERHQLTRPAHLSAEKLVLMFCAALYAPEIRTRGASTALRQES
jgi:uncharacterized RDD family membrane protein YckC